MHLKAIFLRPNWKSTAAAAVFVLSVLVSMPAALAAPTDTSASRGKTLFEDKCASCHTVGGGDLVGPDLAGVTARRDARWLDRFIREPDAVIREKDPIAMDLLARYSHVAMPNLGIGESDAAALSAYFAASGGNKTQVEPQVTLPGAAAGGQHAGNASAGASLFDGSRTFQNHGTQCFACHTLASISPPAGGSLGPDLTRASQKYGGARGMIAVLDRIPFPTMVPVYRDHPLLPQEQADLAAYLGAASGSPVPMTVFVACLGIWVMAGVYMILHSLWHRRLGRIRSSLQAR
jgi:mono/diheme cytochrome c family protein